MLQPHGRERAYNRATREVPRKMAAQAKLPGAASAHARKHERRPAFEPNAAYEHEAARTIAGEGSVCLRRQQPREHNVSVGRNKARDRRCEFGERLEQDIGEDQAVRRAATKRSGADTIRMDELDGGADT